MSKGLSIALLLIGVILLVYGLDASNSVASSVTQAVTGTPTNKTIWLTILGVLCAISGSIGLLVRHNP